MKKLAIISTHPIQYNAPFFKQMAEKGIFEIKVFYTWSQSKSGHINDPDFNIKRKWDIDLLEGYDYCFVDNTAKNPGSHHFFGIINPGLINTIKFYKPDALLVYGWAFQSHLATIRYFKNKLPIIFRGDSNSIDIANGKYAILKSFLRRLFLSWVYQHIDYALFVGKSNYDYYIQMGLKKNQLFYGPHAIDNQRFNSITAAQQLELTKWKKDLGIDLGNFVFLFVGKLESKKNPLLLLEAFKKITHPSAKLVFIGDGILNTIIKDAAQKDARIILLGFQNQSIMPILYRIANLLILPSIGPNETWGLAMNEAMASGLPIIASNKCGGAIDLVIPTTGLTFESDNLDELYTAMNFFIYNPHFCKLMGNYAHKFIQDFSYTSTYNTLAFLINQI